MPLRVKRKKEKEAYMKLFKSPYRAISDEEAVENAAPRHGFVGFFVTLWEYLIEFLKEYCP